MRIVRSCVAALRNTSHWQSGQDSALRALHTDYVAFDYEARRRAVGYEGCNNEFVELVAKRRPDWVWMQLQEAGAITASSIEQAKTRSPETVFVHWTGDARRGPSKYLETICRATDLTLVSGVGLKAQMYAAGARRVEYLQIGLDWQEDVQGEPLWRPDFSVPEVVLCGNHYGGQFPGTGEREGIVRHLRDAGVRVGVVGRGWPKDVPVAGVCAVKQQHHVYRRAKVALSVSHFSDIERYYSDRQLIAMASGAPVVCQYVPGLEREFVNGKHCFWYDDHEEATEHVRRLLEDPGLRDAMGRAARTEVMLRHSWQARIAEAITLVEELAPAVVGERAKSGAAAKRDQPEPPSVASRQGVQVGIKTFNAITGMRVELLEQTRQSAMQAFPGFTGFAYDVGSHDGSEKLPCVASLRAADGNCTPGAGCLLIMEQLAGTADIIVLSDDDMFWKPGAAEKLEAFWCAAPDNIVLVSGFLEPEWHWNTPRETVEHGGVKVLIRDSAPGAAWSFRSKMWPLIRPRVNRGFGFDYDCCVSLRRDGFLVGQLDLADHMGWASSTHGNRAIETAKPLDRKKWGV